MLLEFPSVEAWEAFYNGPTYQGLKGVRDECSSARLVSVVGLDYRGHDTGLSSRTPRGATEARSNIRANSSTATRAKSGV